jgi:hypothetical protein
MPVVVLFFLWMAFLGVVQVLKPEDRRGKDLVVLSGVMNTYFEEPEFAKIVTNSTSRPAFEQDVIGYVSRGSHLRCVPVTVDPPELTAMQELLFVRPGNNVVLLHASPALLDAKVEDRVARYLSNGSDVYQRPSQTVAQLIPHVARLMNEPPLLY